MHELPLAAASLGPSVWSVMESAALQGVKGKGRHEGLRGLNSNSCSSADFLLPSSTSGSSCLELTELEPRQRCSLSHLHCSGEKYGSGSGEETPVWRVTPA